MTRSDSSNWPGRLLAAMLAGGALAVTSGCAKAPPFVPPAHIPPPSITIAAPPETRVMASMVISASSDVNPDDFGRASPVYVRVYQLRTEALFNTLSYDTLFGPDDQKALGQEVISRVEYFLEPSDRRKDDIVLSGETRVLGVFAGFRNSTAKARAFIETPKAQKKEFTVSIERARVALKSVE